MRNRRIIAFTISVSVIGILLSSCGRQCAPYPEDMAKFMPVQYAGGELIYLIGKDTCALKVEKPSLSKGYKLSQRDINLMKYCRSSATQSIGNKNSYLIEYEQWSCPEYIIAQYFITIGCIDKKAYERLQFSYDFADTVFSKSQDYQILSEYIAPTGKTYFPVLFFVDWPTKDSVWISYDEGLVRYVPAQADTTALGQVWQLL